MKTYDIDNNIITAQRKTPRFTELFLPVLSALVILGFAVAFYIIPDSDISENENRELAQAPEFSFERLFSGKLSADVKEYYSDQFPLRGLFIDMKAKTELVLGKKENNGIIYAGQGNMIDRLKTDYDVIDANLSYIKRLSDAVSVPVTAAVAPRKTDALDVYLPSLLRGGGKTVYDAFFASAREYGIDAPDLYTPLYDAAERGEYVYFKTDHHYTTRGAYICYREIMSDWGEEAFDEDAFSIEVAADNFYGTTWSASASSGVQPDKIELFRYDGDENYTVTISDNGKTIGGFYDFGYLSQKDKYGMFLSGTNARVTITANGSDGDRPRLLIINDSFANSMVPFLSRHYDIELCDPRWLRSELVSYINDGGFDRVLVLMNMDSISSSRLLAVIAAGIS